VQKLLDGLGLELSNPETQVVGVASGENGYNFFPPQACHTWPLRQATNLAGPGLGQPLRDQPLGSEARPVFAWSMVSSSCASRWR